MTAFSFLTFQKGFEHSLMPFIRAYSFAFPIIISVFLDIQGGNMKILFYYSWLPTNIIHNLKRVLIKQTLMRLYFSFYGTEYSCLCLLTVQC